MASAGTVAAAALLVSFSAAVVLLLRALAAPPPSGHHAADRLVVSALGRFLLDVGALLELLATRRNMILLCHAILLVILRDAGILGSSRRSSRSRSLGYEPTTAAAAGSVAPVRSRSRAVVWRRRNTNRAAAAAPMHDAHVLVECQPAAEDAATSTWAAPPPPLTATNPASAHAEAEGTEAATVTAAAAAVATLAESPRNDDDDRLDQYHDRDAVVGTAEHHPTAIVAVDGDDDRRIVEVTAGLGKDMEMEMELADDRAFEEFIEKQRRKMRQESMQLQLVSSSYRR